VASAYPTCLFYTTSGALLIPSKISALGIEFSQTDQKSLLSMIALVVLYFLVAFALYASSDFIAWRFAFRAAIRDWVTQTKKREEERPLRSAGEANLTGYSAWEIDSMTKPLGAGRPDLRPLDDYYKRFLTRSRIVSFFSRPAAFLRALFEFVLPLLVGVYAMILLWTAPPRLQQAERTAPIPLVPSSVTTLDSNSPIHLLP